MKRKPITDGMKWRALIYCGGATCDRCTLPIHVSDRIEWDHFLPIALGGTHEYWNIEPMHAACHAAKTRGTGATTAGSDIGKIKKVRHILTGKMVPVKKPVCDGRSKGGYARAMDLTPERRTEIARKAATTRWSKRCKECDARYANASGLCDGCEAYREHTGAI